MSCPQAATRAVKATHRLDGRVLNVTIATPDRDPRAGGSGNLPKET